MSLTAGLNPNNAPSSSSNPPSNPNIASRDSPGESVDAVVCAVADAVALVVIAD